jgi:hypothetical protein
VAIPQEIWGNRCYYCGKAGGNLQREHRIPLARGGDNHISNIVPACGPCNRAKSTLTDDEYFTLLADRFAYGGADGTSADGARNPADHSPVRSALTVMSCECRVTANGLAWNYPLI